MLTLLGPSHRYCDGLSRRSFLRLGGLALGGLSLPQLLRAGQKSHRHRSVIMVYLSGGLAHQDTVDLKPNAPAEVRGEFKPIATSVPGVQLCELLPRLARCADKVAILRLHLLEKKPVSDVCDQFGIFHRFHRRRRGLRTCETRV